MFNAPGAPPVGTERVVSEIDKRDIVRRWNREIEDEIRREATRPRRSGPWKAVTWGALWLLWLALLVGVLTQVGGLH